MSGSYTSLNLIMHLMLHLGNSSSINWWQFGQNWAIKHCTAHQIALEENKLASSVDAIAVSKI